MVSVAEYFYYGLVALFVLVLVGYLGMSFYNDFENTSRNEEMIIDGTQLAKVPKVVSGDKIPESENGRYGVEFTYMTWLFINDLTLSYPISFLINSIK